MIAEVRAQDTLVVALPEVSIEAASDGRYVFDVDDLRGNRIPGVPAQHVFASLRATRRGLSAEIALDAAAATFAGNENTTEIDGYATLDLYAGPAGLPLGGARVQPFLKLSNLLDDDGAVVDARGGRYLEPAPGRTVAASLNVSF